MEKTPLGRYAVRSVAAADAPDRDVTLCEFDTEQEASAHALGLLGASLKKDGRRKD